MADDSFSADVLVEACTAGNLETIQRLFQDPAYVAQALATEECVLHEQPRPLLNLSFMFNKAAAAGSADIVEYLLSFASAHNIPYGKLIHRENICATIDGDGNMAVFEKMLAVKPDAVDLYMGHAGTPLTQAVYTGNGTSKYNNKRVSIVRFLLENGADPNRVSSPYFKGPGFYLENAARYSSIEVTELLLQYSAKIEQSGALHQAAARGRLDVMALLLKHGADVNEQLWENDPWFASKHRTKVKKEFGITSDVSDDRAPKWTHETPLHYSVLARQIEATAWLVENGAIASIEDSKGWTARDMAVKIGDESILEALGLSEAIVE